MERKLDVLWFEASVRGKFENRVKGIKNLKDLKKLNWKKVVQIDIGIGKDRTEFVIRITKDGVKVVYPIEVKPISLEDILKRIGGEV